MKLDDPAMKKIFNIASALQESSILEGLEAGAKVIHLSGVDPRYRFTLICLLMAEAIANLHRTYAVLLKKDSLSGSRNFREAFEKAKEEMENVSPELQLFAALLAHFSLQRCDDPFRAACAALRALGHEIPETLVPIGEAE